MVLHKKLVSYEDSTLQSTNHTYNFFATPLCRGFWYFDHVKTQMTASLPFFK